MKINEILTEGGGTGSLNTSVSHAIPNILVFPELQNQDPYLQYRFGLAVAAAGDKPGEVDKSYKPASVFGEKMAIVARTPEEEAMIKNAAKMYGASAKYKHIGTKHSDENPNVNKVSPVAKLGPVKRKS